jgi:hypothetical protein
VIFHCVWLTVHNAIIQARHNGQNYVFALLTGYHDPPAGVQVPVYLLFQSGVLYSSMMCSPVSLFIKWSRETSSLIYNHLKCMVHFKSLHHTHALCFLFLMMLYVESTELQIIMFQCIILYVL